MAPGRNHPVSLSRSEHGSGYFKPYPVEQRFPCGLILITKTDDMAFGLTERPNISDTSSSVSRINGSRNLAIRS